MKLSEIRRENGTYVAVTFSAKTEALIELYCERNGIQNRVEDLHTTVLYSRKPCTNVKTCGRLNIPVIARPVHFELFDNTSDGKTTKALVLVLKSHWLMWRHKDLMNTHDASYDFDDYIPHITFTYDFGDKDPYELPEFTGEIEIVYEYDEPLNVE